MSDLFHWLGDLLRRLADSIMRVSTYCFDLVLRQIGHGVKMFFAATVVVGASFFVIIATVLRYTPFGLSTSDAVAKWGRLLGANGEFFAWLFYDVLALDYGVWIMLSMIGLILGAWVVYWTTAGILFLVKRI